MTPLKVAVVAKVQRALERRGWTEAELAQRANVEWRTVHRFLKGETFSVETADKLATALREELVDSCCQDSARNRSRSLNIAHEPEARVSRPVVGWKAASVALGVPVATLRRHRRSLGDRMKRPWWASVEALRFWYDGLVTEARTAG